MEDGEKKPLLQIVAEVTKVFEDENLEPREILMVLRELESNATVNLVINHLHEATVKAIEESGLAKPEE